MGDYFNDSSHSMRIRKYDFNVHIWKLNKFKKRVKLLQKWFEKCEWREEEWQVLLI